MVDVRNKKKEQLTVQEFGDLTTGCIGTATTTSIFAFFIGGGTVHLSLHLLKPIIPIRPEVRFLTTILSSVCIGIYAAKVSRESCDKRISDQYDIVNLIR